MPIAEQLRLQRIKALKVVFEQMEEKDNRELLKYAMINFGLTRKKAKEYVELAIYQTSSTLRAT